MKKIIFENFEQKCTGCSACMNACPVNAISMVQNTETFLYPKIDENKCINCNTCSSVCPVNNIKKSNIIPSKMYAVESKDNELRKKSSSGGVFGMMAKEILKRGGYVCGAAFDSKFQLHHVIINSTKNLEPLFQSKYLQSNIGYIYRDILQILNEKKDVLFVGTPCQIAGLKNFLHKDYDNLITMDLICHGVPSQSCFNMYLKEISEKKKANIKNVDFRSKQYGWRRSDHFIKLSLENGNDYLDILEHGCSYLTAFMKNICLRKSCENCLFSELPRHGDITIGDFWGIERHKKEPVDNKGTSFVLINNKKGEKYFNDILVVSSKIESFAFDNNIPNRIHSFYPHSRNRTKFFNNLQNLSFHDSVNSVMPIVNKKISKHDVGLVSNYMAWNFGGILTQYALYCTLKDLGYSVLMIERPGNAPEAIKKNTKPVLYNKWLYPEEDIYPQPEDKVAMQQLNSICDKFVVGSDVLFRISLYKKMGEISTLDWVNNNKTKIAYAASYGYDTVDGNQSDILRMSFNMKQFNFFSCREKSGIELFKKYFDVNATWVLDPAFLCSKEHYDKLEKAAKECHDAHHIACYILDPSQSKNEIISYCGNKLNKQVVLFSEFSEDGKKLVGANVFNKIGETCKKYKQVVYKLEDRLSCIKNSDFVITDSFHGTCLAIIFNKPFICLNNKVRGNTRFDSLLGFLNLNNRIVESLNELQEKEFLFKKMDYKEINNSLKKEQSRCINWLKLALAFEPKQSLSSYDVIRKDIYDKDKKIQNLFDKIDELRARIYKLPNISQTNDYIDELKESKKDKLVILSVRDTPGIELSEELANTIAKSLNLKTNLSGNHQKSYIAIVDDGNVVFEKLDDRAVVKKINIKGINIEVKSAGLNVGNVASILINNKNYSLNKRGLNIVIVDYTNKLIVDSINIDTHLFPFNFYRDKRIVNK